MMLQRTPEIETILRSIETTREKATKGPWFHCQPFMTVAESRTIHGRIPAMRVDYVSTHERPGTPDGHRVLIPMPGREPSMKSDDMAYIASVNPEAISKLVEYIKTLEMTIESKTRREDA